MTITTCAQRPPKILTGTSGNDVLTGTPECDIIHALGGHDKLYGLEGIDWLHGDEGNDYLEGGSGNDYLYGGEGNDVLRGGAGADYLDGGDDKDTVFYDDSPSGVTVDLTRTGKGGHAEGDTYVSIERVRGSEHDDEIRGTDETNTIRGRGGDDVIYGLGSNDVLLGGAGADTLHGGAGNDRLHGWTGNDTLVGGDGSDTYEFAIGDGADVVDNAGVTVGDGRGEAAVSDKVQFGPGIDVRRLWFERSEDLQDLKVSILGTDDSITVKGWGSERNRLAFGFSDGKLLSWDGADALATEMEKPEMTRPATGETWTSTLDPIVAANWFEVKTAPHTGGTVEGGAGADRIYGGDGADTLKGGGGKDTLSGRDGADTLKGGAGADWLFGDEGDDTLYGGAERDHLYGGEDIDTLYGNEGNDYLEGGSGDDELYGGEGSDVLRGGAGVDRLDGGDGNDTVYYDDSPSEVEVDLTKTGKGGHAEGDTYVSIERVRGSEHNDEIRGTGETNTIRGRGGDDKIYGLGGNDVLLGGAGDDTLHGGAGNDRLHGWTGDDTLHLGGGSDVVVFGRGDGHDTVAADGFDAATTDKVKFGAGVKSDDLWFEESGADLKISVVGTADSLTLKDWFKATTTAAGRMDEFQLSNGERLVESRVQSLVTAMARWSTSHGAGPAGLADLPNDAAFATTLAGAWRSSAVG